MRHNFIMNVMVHAIWRYLLSAADNNVMRNARRKLAFCLVPHHKYASCRCLTVLHHCLELYSGLSLYNTALNGRFAPLNWVLGASVLRIIVKPSEPCGCERGKGVLPVAIANSGQCAIQEKALPDP
jgi:hypothetical protein